MPPDAPNPVLGPGEPISYFEGVGGAGAGDGDGAGDGEGEGVGVVELSTIMHLNGDKQRPLV